MKFKKNTNDSSVLLKQKNNNDDDYDNNNNQKKKNNREQMKERIKTQDRQGVHNTAAHPLTNAQQQLTNSSQFIY